jgi:phosphogluconate dehydratase
MRWVALAATGGSTNHAIHLVAMARAAGVLIDWDDLDELSRETPLLVRAYPNGSADVNHFHAAGGIGFVLRELIDAGLVHADIPCVSGGDLRRQVLEPFLDGTALRWRDPPKDSLDATVVRTVADPFDKEGGLRRLQGNLGRAIVKISAVDPEYRRIEAPARVFDSQDALLAAFKASDLHGDFVAVIRGQGPRANGMPELHKLTPDAAVLQDRGSACALLTDGRMSGASARCWPRSTCRRKPPTPARSRASATATRIASMPRPARWMRRSTPAMERARAELAPAATTHRLGRELFALMRTQVGTAEQGACSLFVEETHERAATPLALIADIGGTNARFR